jgi:hypothetical protein
MTLARMANCFAKTMRSSRTVARCRTSKKEDMPGWVDSGLLAFWDTSVDGFWIEAAHKEPSWCTTDHERQVKGLM